MIRDYVLTKEDKNTSQLDKACNEWLQASIDNKMTYEIDWMGIPIIQSPTDMILMQELIYETKPDIIIDIGIAHGGSCVYYASLLELLGDCGCVIGIDIDIRKHNLKALKNHEMYGRIFLLEGDSTSEEIIKQVDDIIQSDDKVLVCLDSNHTMNHVYKELELYSKYIKKNGYIVVFDTVSAVGPMNAIEKFIDKDSRFAIDAHYNKLYISYCKNGFLRRIK